MGIWHRLFGVNTQKSYREFRFFGLKFRVDRKSRIDRRRWDGIAYLLGNLHQPESFPKARGILRDLQLAEVKMLREVDRVCEKNGLRYWISFGSLIGAVRHRGVFPWDDDVDISMPRGDYDRFLEAFNRDTADPDLRAEIFMVSRNNVFLKVRHKRVQSMHVDIFPYDCSGERLEPSTKVALYRKIVRERAKNRFPKNDHRAVLSHYSAYRDRELTPGGPVPESDCRTLVIGSESSPTNARYANVFDYEDVFPLRRMEFEGFMVSCPANPYRVLTYLYGDYMVMPQYPVVVHNALDGMDLDQLLALRDYVADMNPETSPGVEG